MPSLTLRVLRFQFFFYRHEDPLERRTGLVYGHFAHDVPLQSGKPGLVRPFDGNDVEGGALRIFDETVKSSAVWK
jgi:hypothetical protein